MTMGHSKVPDITGPQYAIDGALTPATPLIQNNRNWYVARIGNTVAVSCGMGNTRMSK